jgi:site-specific recombinase XerD
MSQIRDRTSKQHEPLGTAGVYRAVKLAAEEAGLDRARVKPHLLRATAITRMCNAGMHPAMVSEITGVSVAVIARHYQPSRARRHVASGDEGPRHLS